MHGWGGSTDSFIGIARALAHKYRVILVDFAGFGDTKEPNKPYKLSDYTDDLDALLDEINVKECFFVAHSFGGRVAIDYVTRYSGRVNGMVLCDSAGMKPKRGIKYHYRVTIYKLKRKLGLNIDKMGSNDYRTLSDVMKRTFVNIVNEHLDDRLKYIDVPTLIIFGDKDKDTPMYMARRLNKGIKSSELIVFEGRGHFAYLEESYRFALIVDSFVGGC